MRRLRLVVLVAALAVTLGWTVPAAAQAEGWMPASWASLPGSLIDWAARAWWAVAGSETGTPPAEPVDPDGPQGVTLDGAGETFFGGCEPEGERYPTIDPDG